MEEVQKFIYRRQVITLKKNDGKYNYVSWKVLNKNRHNEMYSCLQDKVYNQCIMNAEAEINKIA